MHLFYAPYIDPEYHILNQEESKHCRVLRIKTGDFVYLTDGAGTMCKTIITDTSTGIYHTKIIERQNDYNKRPYKLHIAIAPTKNTDRFEWFIEKATEIGIDEITPVICEHSEKIHLKFERLQKVLISALKQSFGAYLPKLNPLMSFSKFVETSVAAQKFIAYCPDGFQHLNYVYQGKNDSIIMIGPEGDFSENEILLSEKNGYLPISLGKNRLRTETAGIVACSIINTANSK